MTTVDARTGARAVTEVLAWSRARWEPSMRAAVDRLPGSMRRIAGFHFGWWDEQGRATHRRGGKALRPALVLLCAEAAGGDPEDAVAAAVAVELVHNFSLLHDDVMDRDETRHHRPTAWTAFGTGPAILAGDALLALAFDVLAPDGPDATRRLGRAVLDLLEGQGEDVAFERRGDVTPAECVRMAAGKTGALIGVACTLGALVVGGRGEQVGRLGVFGRSLGLAFQHVDDLLGIWGDPAATGKPVYSDLQNRKKSLPVVAALAAGTPAARELASLYEREASLSEGQLAHAASLVDSAGGREWSRSQAATLLTTGLTALASARPTPRAAAELAALARLITRRDH
ncbi:family 2 encapsulin nanocompartment cargo protein polyprenyl transferase [Amycolatopsis sp. PS_44_ISF1]|uniref:family 2 encapsulin nanocompartment cargo protein polyprenyl transferase n=1 Tax=Amycolatopsis sp. PS_44_ISF1 TaxID=2974917 RepID=UPI0028DFB1BD|nr:family 2 encapsulin nanocompartment cargo protein polyprenyl transferase [Amycolatopsis sp. PS_44_ISF1]MDT8916113.1 polyprenyl synthetase family protein [Amycolatopsis sp. PS_44_ISF1]